MRRDVWSEWVWRQLAIDAITLEEACVLLGNEWLCRRAELPPAEPRPHLYVVR